MLPVNPGGHAAYQDTFVSEFLKHYPDPFALPKSTWDYIVQFWHLDLSATDSIMRDCYSVYGPPPRLPSCMLRSYLLALKLKVTSITLWCRMLKETPLYALLSGFPVGDTPGGAALFMTFFRAFGKGIPATSPRKTASLKRSRRKERRKATKPRAILPARPPGCSPCWNAGN